MVRKRLFSGIERSDRQKASILITLHSRSGKFGRSVSFKSYRKQQQQQPQQPCPLKAPGGSWSCEFLIVDTDGGIDHPFPGSLQGSPGSLVFSEHNEIGAISLWLSMKPGG
jgi:hypothetical protein